MRVPVVTLVASVVLASGCAAKTASPEVAVQSAVSPVETPPPPPPPPPAPPQRVQSEGMLLEWVVEGDRLRCTMSAPTSGWVQVGFNTVRAQHLANMITGWVDDDGAHVVDRYAVDPPVIQPDLELGGRSDVKLVSGDESNGRTRVQFTLPLDSGDPYDLALSPGQQIYLILSYGADDDLSHLSVLRTAVPIQL